MDSPLDQTGSSVGMGREASKADSGTEPDFMESIRLDYQTVSATFSLFPQGRQPLDYFVEIGQPIPGAHVAYPIKGRDSTGEFQVQRRFSDFFALHQYVQSRWPGIPIPQIPPKKLIGNKSDEVVTFRKMLLEAFLKASMQTPFIYNTDEFHVFLHGSDNFKAACGAMKRYSIVEIAGIYAQTFPEFASREFTPAITASLESDFQGLSRMLSDFQQCARITANLSRSFSLLQTTYGHFSESMLVFEEANLAQLSSEMRVPKFKKWEHESRQNPFEILSTWFMLETFQIQSLLQVYDSRRRLQNYKDQLVSKRFKDEANANKLRGGHNTFMGFITGKSKPAQIAALEWKIKDSEGAIQALGALHTLVTVRLHDYELVQFKKQKAELYESVMKRFGSIAAAEYSSMVEAVAEMKTALPEAEVRRW